MRSTFVFFVAILALLIIGCRSGSKQTADNNGSPEPKILESIRDLTRQIENNPENDQLYIERATLYMALDSLKQAIRDITIATDINKLNPDYYIILSEAWLMSGNPDNSMEALEKALEIAPRHQEALLKKAQLYLIMKKYESTYETIQQLLSIDQFNPQAYFVRAYALLEQGDTAGAVRNLLKAIDQKQDYFEAFMQMGLIYAARHNPLAVEYFNNAIQVRPTSTEAYYQLGLFFQEHGEPRKAVEIYENILNLDPHHTDALYNIGYVNLVYFHDFEKAIEYFNKVIELEPTYWNAWFNRGYSYELLGNLSQARKDYQKTLELDINNPKAIDGLNRLDNYPVQP